MADASPGRVPSDPSPHVAPDGRFRNPWANAEPPTFRDVLRWRRTRGTGPRPAPVLPSRVPPAIDAPRGAPDTLAATWIGHSTVLLQVGTLNVLTDPMWSRRASPVRWAGPARLTEPGLPLDALPPIDIVLVSHNHYDHLDAASVRALVRRHPAARWFVPLGVARYVRRWGARAVAELDWWHAVDDAGVRIACVPAQHGSGRTPFNRMQSLWCGFTLRAGAHSIYFAGDTAYHPEFGEIARREGPFDLCVLPIGAYEPRWFMRPVHVNPEEAVRAHADIAAVHPDRPPPVALAVHWGAFTLADEPVDEPPRRAQAAWGGSGFDAARLWILSLGETRRVPARGA
ncbi:MAG TPA: MBL fold metallo-hydrolase [Gemmatimonadaceae bacterium]|nr:MBL fold metallo-hydrolase [Gemmatimonadaceae bacterium]